MKRHVSMRERVVVDIYNFIFKTQELKQLHLHLNINLAS